MNIVPIVKLQRRPTWHTVQKFRVGKIFKCFWKKSLSDAAFTVIWLLLVFIVILWNIITI